MLQKILKDKEMGNRKIKCMKENLQIANWQHPASTTKKS